MLAGIVLLVVEAAEALVYTGISIFPMNYIKSTLESWFAGLYSDDL